jgi:amino acid permease
MATKDMVTLNLPHDGLTATIQIVYSLGLVGSYPIQMMPVFQIVEKSALYQKIPNHKRFKILKDLVWRSVAVILTAVSAMVIPRLGLFLNLVGSFACTALAFILPVVIYDKLHKEETS